MPQVMSVIATVLTPQVMSVIATVLTIYSEREHQLKMTAQDLVSVQDFGSVAVHV